MKKLFLLSILLLSFSSMAGTTFEDVKHMLGANEAGLVEASQCDTELNKENVRAIKQDLKGTAVFGDF